MFAFALDSVRVFSHYGKINVVLCLSPLPGLVCQVSTPLLLPLGGEGGTHSIHSESKILCPFANAHLDDCPTSPCFIGSASKNSSAIFSVLFFRFLPIYRTAYKRGSPELL